MTAPTTVIDLSRLPPPNAIEPLSYEAILAAYKAAVKEALRAVLPDWNPDLESDTLVILLQNMAYREVVLRAHANDVARANLLAFAGAADLDHLAAFYGVERQAGEADDALRLRVQTRIIGWSSAGGAAHYRYWALSASPDVDDAAVDSPAPGVVRIAVLSRAGTGSPSAELLDAVRAVVGRDDIRVLTDTLDVVAATVRTVDVVARVWLYPDTPYDVFDRLAPDLARSIDQARGLGWDLTRSWLIGRLQAGGVHRVELVSPAADVVVGADACVALGALRVEFAGRSR